jgi:hypothetical protein
MLNQLIAKNHNLPIFSVGSEEFRTYGRVVRDLDTAQIVATAEKIKNPDTGASYLPEEESLAKLPIAKTIQDRCFGTLPTQIGYCWGHNRMLNATEWHTSSEINIAVTDIVLRLAHVWEIEDGKIDSSAFRAFYVPKGTAVEVYATSLHFTPCEVREEGFGCVVALPAGTNTPLNEKADDPLLFRKNKWLICHEENKRSIANGVVPGITGCNYCLEY